MAKKKARRKKHRARRSNPKKKRRVTRRAAHRRAAPKKRRHVRRKKARNPKRRHMRARAHKRNPGRFKARRHARRRARRRNPFGFWGEVGVGLLAVVAGYAATFGIAALVTKDMPKDGARNRGIVGAILAAVGLYLAKKRKFGTYAGLGLAGGAVLQAIDSKVNTFVYGLLPQPATTTTTPTTTSAVYADNLSAVVPPNLGGYERAMGAVYADNLAGLISMQGIGDQGDPQAPGAPWAMSTPFDSRGY